MPRPSNCSSEIYKIMLKCWEFYPCQRPTFNDIVSSFESLIQSNANYLALTPSSFNNTTYLMPSTKTGGSYSAGTSNVTASEDTAEAADDGQIAPDGHELTVAVPLQTYTIETSQV